MKETNISCRFWHHFISFVFVGLMKWWKTELHLGYQNAPKHVNYDFQLWFWSIMHPVKLKRNPRPSSLQKIASRPRCSSGHGNLFLFVCLITVSGRCSARHPLCLCALLVLHMCPPGTRGLREGFHWSCKFLCPSLRSCGTLQPSH